MVPSLVNMCVTTINTELIWLQQQEQQHALGAACAQAAGAKAAGVAPGAGAGAAGALGAAKTAPGAGAGAAGALEASGAAPGTGAAGAFGARTAGQARRRWLWELSRILAPEVQLLLLAQLSRCCLLTSDALRALFGPHSSARGATRTLDLSGNLLLDASAIVSTVACLSEPAHSMAASDGLVSLTSLNLSKIESLRDADIAAIVCSSVCHLRSLQLSGCVQITCSSIHAISKECGQLQLLDVSECWQVAEILPLIACSQLRSLELHGCWAIPPDQVSAVLHAIRHSLGHLGLARCCQMDHRAFASMWSNLPASLTDGSTGQGMSRPAPPQHQHRSQHFCGLSLTSLDVSSTQIDSTTLALLALLAPRLTRLSLTSCSRISGISVLNFVHLRGAALRWSTCGGAYDGAVGTPDAAAHTVGTLRTHMENPGAAGNPDGAGYLDAAEHTVSRYRGTMPMPPAAAAAVGAAEAPQSVRTGVAAAAHTASPAAVAPPAGSCAARTALSCLQPPTPLESLAVGGIAWKSTTGIHSTRTPAALAEVRAAPLAGAAAVPLQPPPPPPPPPPPLPTVVGAPALTAAAAAVPFPPFPLPQATTVVETPAAPAAAAAGAAVPFPSTPPPLTTSTAGPSPPGAVPEADMQASHQVSSAAPSAAEARTPPPALISTALPSSPPSFATLLHAARLCCAAYMQCHPLAQTCSTASVAPRTHMPSVPSPVPPSPPHWADLLPELTQRLSAAAAATAAAAQADGEDEGGGEAHGGDALDTGGWAGEEGDLSEDDGAAIVHALLGPPLPLVASVPSPLRLTHLDVSGAHGAVGSREVRLLADRHAHTLQSLNLQGCAAASMATSGGSGGTTDHEEEDIEGCLFGLARLSLLTSLNLGGSEGVSADQRQGASRRWDGGWGSLPGDGGGAVKRTRVTGSGFWRPSPAVGTRSGGGSASGSLPSLWHSSGGDGSSGGSSSLFQLQQEQQQLQQGQRRYHGKRPREGGYAGGGAAKEEDLALVMRTLCKGNGAAAGDEMSGGHAVVHGGNKCVADKSGPNPGVRSSSSSSSSASECPGGWCLGNSSRQMGPRTGGRLRSLCLSHTSIGDGCLSALQGLTSLDITGCKRVGDTGVLQVLLRCRQLQVLRLSSIPALTPSALGGPMSSAMLTPSAPGADIPSPLSAAAQTPSTLGGPLSMSPSAAAQSTAAAAARAAGAGQQRLAAALELAGAHPGGAAAPSPSAAAAYVDATHGTAPTIRGPLLKLPAAKLSSNPSMRAARACQGRASPRGGLMGRPRKLPATYAPPPAPAPLPPPLFVSEDELVPLQVTSPRAAAPETQPPSGTRAPTPSAYDPTPHVHAPPPQARAPPPHAHAPPPLAYAPTPQAPFTVLLGSNWETPATHHDSAARISATNPGSSAPTSATLPASATPASAIALSAPSAPVPTASPADTAPTSATHPGSPAPTSATHPASATPASTTRSAHAVNFSATHSAPAAPFSGRGPCLSAISLPRGTASPACVSWLPGGLIPRHTLPQAQLCTQLQKVEIVGARGVDDMSLVALTQSCPCLRLITLKGADHVSDAGALSVLSCCPALRRFTLTGSPRVSDATLSLALSRSRRPLAAQSHEGLRPLAAQLSEGLTPGTAIAHKLQLNKKRQRGEGGQAVAGPDATPTGAQEGGREAGLGRARGIALGPNPVVQEHFGLRVGADDGLRVGADDGLTDGGDAGCNGASKAKGTTDACAESADPPDGNASEMADADNAARAGVEAADFGAVHTPHMAGSLTHLDLSGCPNITGKPFMDLLQLPPLSTCPLHHPLHGQQAPSILQHSASQQQQEQRQHAPRQDAAQQQGHKLRSQHTLAQQQQSILTQAQAHQLPCSCPPSLRDLIHTATRASSAQQQAISAYHAHSSPPYPISSAPPSQQQQASNLPPSQQAQHAQHLESMHSMVAGMRMGHSPSHTPIPRALCSPPHTRSPSSPLEHTSSPYTAPQQLHLRTLKLNQCKRVSESAVVAACVASPHLSSLSVHGVSGVTQVCLEVMSAATPNIKEIEAGGTSVTSVPSSLLLPSSPSPSLLALPSSTGHGFTSDSVLASGFLSGQGLTCSQPHTLAATHGSNNARMDEVYTGMPASPFAALSSLQLPFALRTRLTSSGVAAACTQHRPWLKLTFSG